MVAYKRNDTYYVTGETIPPNPNECDNCREVTIEEYNKLTSKVTFLFHRNSHKYYTKEECESKIARFYIFEIGNINETDIGFTKLY